MSLPYTRDLTVIELYSNWRCPVSLSRIACALSSVRQRNVLDTYIRLVRSGNFRIPVFRIAQQSLRMAKFPFHHYKTKGLKRSVLTEACLDTLVQSLRVLTEASWRKPVSSWHVASVVTSNTGCLRPRFNSLFQDRLVASSLQTIYDDLTSFAFCRSSNGVPYASLIQIWGKTKLV